MSSVLIRAALETALAAMTPSLATAYENAPFTVPSGAYQRCAVLFAEPAVTEMSGTHHREQGYMQVTLCYPLGAGAGAAQARAELIRSTFYRGRTFTSGSVSVIIERHPEIIPGRADDDRFIVPVKIRFFANIVRS